MRKPEIILLLFSLPLLLLGCRGDQEQAPDPILYTDQEVEAFLAKYPGLTDEYGESPTPENILQRLEIDEDLLEPIERYVGDCLCFVAYALSPSYVLVVDDNACFGYHVYIQKRAEYNQIE